MQCKRDGDGQFSLDIVTLAMESFAAKIPHVIFAIIR